MVNNKSGQRRGILSIILVMILLMSSLLYSSMVTGTGSIDEPPIILSPPIKNSPAIDQTAEIENIINNVTEDLMAGYIQELQDFGTRYSYAVEKNFLASEFIYDSFEANGLTTYYDYFIYNRKMRNVVAELPGKTASDEIFIICAHYDSTSASPYASAPGADDNGSGTTAVLVAAEILSDYEFNHTIRFIAFSGEEQGLKGSAHYASNSKALGENITAVINLDMFGYNPDPGSTTIWAKFNGNVDAEDLSNYTNSIAENYTSIVQLGVKIGPAAGNSDHHYFGPEYPAIHIFEDQFSPYYHKTTDTIDKLNMTYIANGTQIAIATIAELAGLNSTDIAPPAPHDMFPAPGTYGMENTTMSVVLKDPSGIDLANLKMLVNGTEISPSISSAPLGYNLSHTTLVDFIDGDTITVRIIVNDTMGNMLDYNWTFIVDAIYPSLPSDFNIELVRTEMVKQGLVLDKGLIGDADGASAPSVVYHDNEYKMWYTGYNNSRYRILYANSTNGISWNQYGIVIPLGASGEADDYYAAYPSVLFEDGEYKIWYSGYDGSNWRIMYANSSDGLIWSKHGVVVDLGSNWEFDNYRTFGGCVIREGEYKMWYSADDGVSMSIMYANSTDGMVWTKLKTPVLTHSYEGEHDDFCSLYPSVIFDEGEYKMWYSSYAYGDQYYRIMYANSSDGISWNRLGMALDTDGSTVHVSHPSAMMKDGEIKLWYAGLSGGSWRIFYANQTGLEDKTDLMISWASSSSTDVEYYDLVRASTPAGLSGAPRYQRLNGTTLVEYRLGDGNSSNYYYALRVVDRVGHVSQHPLVVGKIGVDTTAGWNLLSSPFLEGDVSLGAALITVPWQGAYYYDPTTPADHWRSNFTSRSEQFNDLDSMNNTMAMWASTTDDVFVTIGEVSNITIQLYSGWNFVAYPYHEEKQVQDALFGLPYTIVEGFDDAAPYRLTTLAATGIMRPGFGYWIYCTSATEWQIVQP